MMSNFLDVTLGTENINTVFIGNRLIWERDTGLAKDYPGTGWYKATDTGVVYNKDIPEGETHTFKGDPIEYISVWRNDGLDMETFRGTEEDIQKLIDWQKNLHRYATSNVTDMSLWLYAYGNVDVLGGIGVPPELVVTDPANISHYDTSSVTSMSRMFNMSTFNQPLDNFDTSNVTDMSYMFNLAINFNQPLDNFDTSNVTDMSYMFDAAYSFNQPLDNFDTSNVTTVESMFAWAESFNQDISHWNVSNVTNMSEMFDVAISFNQDISTWDTSSVTNMGHMFMSASSFNQDLSQWCVPSITNLPSSFNSGASKWTLPKPVWGTCPRGEDGSEPEPTDQGLAKDYPGTGWYKATDTGIVYNKDVPEGETHIFEGDPIEYISVWRYVLDTENFTGSEEDIQKLVYWHNNLHRFATSNVTDMSVWLNGYDNSDFYGQIGISPDDVNTNVLSISHYDTSNVTKMDFMFSEAPSFNQDISSLDTSNVVSMYGMFHNATSFNQDISSLDTSNVVSMSEMFSGASSFNQDLSQWCVPLITSLPFEFDDNTTNWTLPRPVWGTCPRGEDSI